MRVFEARSQHSDVLLCVLLLPLRKYYQNSFQECTKSFTEEKGRTQQVLGRDINNICRTKKLQVFNSHAKFCKDQCIRLIDNVKESKWKFVD